jgi:hypothetical protein
MNNSGDNEFLSVYVTDNEETSQNHKSLKNALKEIIDLTST